MVSLGGIGRIRQGMDLGRAPPIDAAKVAEAAANVASGGKLAAAKTAIKTAGNATGGFAQGAALGAGYRASGLFGKIFGFFWDTIIANNNEYDLFIKIAAVMYFTDFIHGFNQHITLAAHLVFALVAFILIGERDANISRWNYVWVTIIFLNVWQVFLQGPLYVVRATGGMALLALAFVMYLRSDVPMPLRGIPYVAAIDVLVMNVFRVPLLQYAENAGFAFVAISYVMNRLLNPILLLYGLIYMKKESPVVAGRIFVIVFFIYLFAAAAPMVGPTVNYLRGGSAPLTSEEGQQAGNVITTAARSAFNLFTLKFVKPSIAYAAEKAEEAFGFGEPKEEPKMGLQLLDDPTMLSEFKKSRDPSPSFLIKVPNPFPPDFKKKYLEVIGIECIDKTGTDTPIKFHKVVDEFNVVAYEDKPLEVDYTGERGGKTITCSQCGSIKGDASCWESGRSYTIEANVKYRVEADAYLSTSFMKAAELRNLRGEDPAVVEGTPIEKAEYSNVPVSLTWGPIELVTSPAPVDFVTGQTPGQSSLGIKIYVAKNPTWGGGKDSEIHSIKGLNLTVPEGVELEKSGACAFEAIPKVPNKYRLKSEWTDNFIGEYDRFDCGLIIKPAVLHGADWAAARFDLEGVFIFAEKKEGITFAVTDSPAAKLSNPPPGSCGDGTPSGSESCDWGVNAYCGGNGDDPSGSTCSPIEVPCPDGSSVRGKYRCKSDCSGYINDTSSCSSPTPEEEG